MKTFLRRLALVMTLIACVTIVATVMGWRLVRGTPDWYPSQVQSVEERERSAQRATNKLALAQNQAAQARADEQIARSKDAKFQVAPIVISFSDDEVNAFFEKWTIFQSIKSSYDHIVRDPSVIVKDGRVILAGHLSELGTVASLHFEPSIDSDGRLNMKLVRVLAGKLPLPQVMLMQFRSRAIKGIETRIPTWRQEASIDPTGIANQSAISASAGEMVLDLLNSQSAEPVMFLPIAERGSIPVRISELHIEDHSLKLVVYPMTPDERATLLQKIRNGSTLASGKE